MLPHYKGKDLRFTFHHQVRPFSTVDGTIADHIRTANTLLW